MLPLYKDIQDSVEIRHQKSRHRSPHLHASIECIYLTEGTLALGVGQTLFPMEEGDFAIIFPDIIHHYQVFEPKKSKAIHLLASPSLGGPYLPVLQQSCPQYPVVPQKNVHPDVVYAMNSLLKNKPKNQDKIINQSFLQIILGRCMPFFTLTEKSTSGSNDIIYQTVSYIAAHFTENVSLTGMAHDLGFSPYALSRVFSGTFHRNFNQYLNEIRLDYVCELLHYTDQSITEAYENAGFESQRTFNRVFRERYHMTPREYRNLYKTTTED